MEYREIWKDIKGYEGKYQISNLGRVRNKKKIMKPFDNGYGYLVISLKKNNIKKNFYIHRLVADAFCSKENRGNVVNHKDFNKKNNTYTNLEWCTQKENIMYSAERMRKPKIKMKSSTNELYISYRKRTQRYRVTIQRKEYKSFSSLDEAIIFRDEQLRRLGLCNP